MSRRADLAPVPEWTKFVAVAMGLGLAAGAAIGAVDAPAVTLAAAAALTCVAVLLRRPVLAAALLVASFYFDSYLAQGAGILTFGKAIGAVAVAAWVLQWVLRGVPVVGDWTFWLLAVLAALILASSAGALDSSQALLVGSRYFQFFILYFLVVQVAASRTSDVADPVGALIDVAVLAATVSALIGLIRFLSGTVHRANGPLQDANDYAFLLASTLPLVIYRARSAKGRPARLLFTASLCLLSVTLFATLSRTAAVGLGTAAVWTLATHRLKARWVAALGLTFAAVAAALFLASPNTVRVALNQKQHVAQQNVANRLTFYRVALEEFRTSPLFGVGPGNFQVRYPEFTQDFSFQSGAYTTHNAYLNVLADLGLPACLLFVAFVVGSWLRLRCVTGDERGDARQTAIAAGFVVAAVGSLFLTEQFYSPLWLLPALGVANLRSMLRPSARVR